MREGRLGSFRRLTKRLTKTALLLVGAWAVLWLGMEAAARLQGMTPEKRFALYEIRTLVRPGMTDEEVKGLLPTIERKGLEHRWAESGLSVWTHVGLMRPYFLLIEIQDGRVAHASIRDGEGGARVPDAPPDF